MIHQILANDRFWMARPTCSFSATKTCSPTRPGASSSWLVILASGSTRARRPGSPPYTRTNRTRRAPKRCGVDCRKPAWISRARPTPRSATRRPSCTGTTFVRGIRSPGSALANPRQRRMLERLCGRWLKARGYSADSDEPGEAKVRPSASWFAPRSTSWWDGDVSGPEPHRCGIRERPGPSSEFSGFPPTPRPARPRGRTRLRLIPRPGEPGEPHISFTKKSDEMSRTVGERRRNVICRSMPATMTYCVARSAGEPRGCAGTLASGAGRTRRRGRLA